MVLCKRKPVIFAPLPELNHPSLTSLLPPAVKAEVEPEASDVRPGKGKGKKAVVQGPSEEEKERELIQALATSTHSAANGPSKGSNKQIECWYIPQTGEVFLDYESYSQRIHFYRLPLFQCEVTGRSSLTYYEAYRSEQAEARKLNVRLPATMQRAVLGAVQFQMEGRIDDLADRVYDRFHNRYFDDEKIFVDVNGEKFFATIRRVFPPSSLSASSTDDIHPFARKLDLPIEEVLQRDDPMAYRYQVELIGWNSLLSEAERNGEVEEGPRPERIILANAAQVSRDRLNFSKAILKRFMKESVVRDPAAYSPWVVKAPLSKRFSIPTEMSEEQLGYVNRYREIKMEQRKRGREDKDGPSKKQKLHDEKQIRDEVRAREKAEDEKPNVNGKRKKPTKYPAEDLIVEVTAKERKDGRVDERPLPSKDLPFAENFEKFLTTWSFLNVLGAPLNLSSFTLDEFETALYHRDPTTACTLIAEIHACLLTAIAKDLSASGYAVRPLAEYGPSDSTGDATAFWEGEKGATVDMIQPIASECAANWVKQQLSVKDGRKGWESSLIGCLWERASLETHPQYLDIILHLLFQDQPPLNRPTWATANSTAVTSHKGFVPAKPDKRFPTLHAVYKLNTLAFLCELAVQTSVARAYMDEATLQLTATRNFQLDVRRELRKIREEIGILDPKEADGLEDGDINMERAGSVVESVNGTVTGTGTERDELDSVNGHSEGESEAASDSSRRKPSRRRAIAVKQAQQEAEAKEKKLELAKNMQQARLKKAESKQQLNDRKRLADEEEVLIKREKQYELDFRSYINALRPRPMGQDRFCNKIWWMDGMGSHSLVGPSGQIVYGTGRLYIQGASPDELEIARKAVFVPIEELEESRERVEGEGRLQPGEWAVYDTVEQLYSFRDWLNPKGWRERSLLRELAFWWPELEGGMLKRHAVLNGEDEPIKRSRRQTADGKDASGWRNRRAEGAK